jgi:quercetin 2,3-dioxygenase
MSDSPVLRINPLGFQWQTVDPFLFCVHHQDAYPRGNGALGPAASLEGRDIGQDFAGRDGWRMYHGDRIPGFPAHPHRGFETVTVVLRGLVDHSDSHGAAGRYGNGDVQWMTAGSGLQHAEMFPLLRTDADNPLELFQIWLNLPKTKKFVAPHFKMLWAHEIPVVRPAVQRGDVQVRLIAGVLDGIAAPAPAPDSYAAEARADCAIWIISLDADTEWQLPEASPEARRVLYCFEGKDLAVAGEAIPPYHAAELRADRAVTLRTGAEAVRLLLLQGVPLDEPVVQYGPFVMNTRTEIQEAFADYQRTRFGGWPWERADNVHGPDRARFARHADGRLEEPPDAP